MNINKYILIIIAILILLVFGWREYGHYYEKKAIKEGYVAVIDFKEGEKSQIKNTLDLKVADEVIMKQNIMSSDIANDQLVKEIEGFREINSYMKMEVLSVIKRLEIKYNEYNESNSSNPFEGISLKDDEYIHKDDVDKNFLRTPKVFEHKDDSGWFYIGGVINKESLTIDSLMLFNKYDATIGFKRPNKKFGWIRKKEPVVVLRSYGPYTDIANVNNVIVEKKKNKVGSIFLSKPAMFVYGLIAGKAFLN